MKQNRTIEVNELLDWYGCLLTERQMQICQEYYFDDLSLSELSENYNISRAAVSDMLKRSEKIMRDYEEKLNLVEKFHVRIEIYDKMKSYGFEEINQLVIQLEKNEE